MIEPAAEGIVLADWNLKNRDWVEAQLLVHGGILFRNFNLPSPADFERAAKSIYGELFADYGDLPRNAAGEKIYESTPYPPDQMILFHNESSHLPSFPMKISFHCVTPAKKTITLDDRGRGIGGPVVHHNQLPVGETSGSGPIRSTRPGIAPG